MGGMIRGTGLERSALWVLERIVNPNSGAYISQATIADIAYEIHDAQARRKIAGAKALTIANVVWDSLQLGKGWTADTLGWNLAFTVPGDYFPAEGTYRVDVRFVPVTGATFYTALEVATTKLFFGDP